MTGVFLRQIRHFGAGWKGRWAAVDGFCQLFVMDWQGGCFVANSNKNALYRHSRADGNLGVGFSGIDRKGLLCDGLDCRLRGNDDGRHFLF